MLPSGRRMGWHYVLRLIGAGRQWEPSGVSLLMVLISLHETHHVLGKHTQTFLCHVKTQLRLCAGYTAAPALYGVSVHLSSQQDAARLPSCPVCPGLLLEEITEPVLWSWPLARM